VEFDFDASKSQSFTVILTEPGAYRVAYVNLNNESIYGVVLDSETTNDVFIVSNKEKFVAQGRMEDTVPKARFVFEPWHIFVIISGTIVFAFLIVAIVLLATGQADLDGRRSSSVSSKHNSASSFSIRRSTSDFGSGRASAAEAAPERAPGPAVKAFRLTILAEWRDTYTALGVFGWLLWLVVRPIVMMMMLIIAYLGFVNFLFFSLLAIIKQPVNFLRSTASGIEGAKILDPQFRVHVCVAGRAFVLSSVSRSTIFMAGARQRQSRKAMETREEGHC
jgi:hypothetical protein